MYSLFTYKLLTDAVASGATDDISSSRLFNLCGSKYHESRFPPLYQISIEKWILNSTSLFTVSHQQVLFLVRLTSSWSKCRLMNWNMLFFCLFIFLILRCSGMD